MAYNHSENAVRQWTALRRVSGVGKTRILIRCPFCRSESWAYVWSLCGGGKRCEYKPCGAMFGSTGDAAPVVGREDKFNAGVALQAEQGAK